LHPGLIPRLGQNADSGRVARKGFASKGINLKYLNSHSVSPHVARLTLGFTRAAGLVKELPPQEQLQVRVTADFERRQPRRVQAVVS